MNKFLKRLASAVLAGVATLTVSSALVGCNKSDDVLDKEILIGSWVTYYNPEITPFEDQVKLLAESGVNFNLYPFAWYEPQMAATYEDWVEIDRVCRKYGIIYGMTGVATKSKYNETDEAFANIKEWSNKLKSPNLRFVNVYDEPFMVKVPP